MEFINGISTFTLKHNQNKLATGLPLGVNYNVIESDNEGYSVSSEKAIGSISSEETAYVRFTNTIIPSTGNLSVHKTVLGNNIETNKEFTFTVTLSDNTVNGTYGDMEFINGVSTFKLKHNESKQAVSLPKGITYTVTESDNEGYSVSSKNSVGNITKDNVIVDFENTLTILFEVPHTADNSNAIMWIATLIISSIGILSIIALKNRYL